MNVNHLRLSLPRLEPGTAAPFAAFEIDGNYYLPDAQSGNLRHDALQMVTPEGRDGPVVWRNQSGELFVQIPGDPAYAGGRVTTQGRSSAFSLQRIDPLVGALYRTLRHGEFESGQLVRLTDPDSGQRYQLVSPATNLREPYIAYRVDVGGQRQGAALFRIDPVTLAATELPEQALQTGGEAQFVTLDASGNPLQLRHGDNHVMLSPADADHPYPYAVSGQTTVFAIHAQDGWTVAARQGDGRYRVLAVEKGNLIWAPGRLVITVDGQLHITSLRPDTVDTSTRRFFADEAGRITGFSDPANRREFRLLQPVSAAEFADGYHYVSQVGANGHLTGNFQEYVGATGGFVSRRILNTHLTRTAHSEGRLVSGRQGKPVAFVQTNGTVHAISAPNDTIAAPHFTDERGRQVMVVDEGRILKQIVHQFDANTFILADYPTAHAGLHDHEVTWLFNPDSNRLERISDDLYARLSEPGGAWTPAVNPYQVEAGPESAPASASPGGLTEGPPRHIFQLRTSDSEEARPITGIITDRLVEVAYEDDPTRSTEISLYEVLHPDTNEPLRVQFVSPITGELLYRTVYAERGPEDQIDLILLKNSSLIEARRSRHELLI